jgi:glycerol-3-phosphate acyltransferase PlsY
VQYVTPVVISYLLGSIIFSFVVGKCFRGIDIRKHGSGNAGATNTLRVIGIGPALLVLVLDAAKGIAAVWLGIWLGQGSVWAPILSGLAVIIGHNWPIFFGFRGGKGVATTIGVIATLSFLPTLIACIIAIATIALTRYVSLGSLILTALLPILLFLMNRPHEIFLASILIFIFALVRHRTNIIKLIQGRENKIGAKREGM